MEATATLPDRGGPVSIDALARALIQSAPSAVVALDTDGNVTMLNRHAQKLLDCSLESAVVHSGPERDLDLNRHRKEVRRDPAFQEPGP